MSTFRQIDNEIIFVHKDQLITLFNKVILDENNSFTLPQLIRNLNVQYQAWAYFAGDTENDLEAIILTTVAPEDSDIVVRIIGFATGGSDPLNVAEIFGFLNDMAAGFGAAFIEVKTPEPAPVFWGNNGFTTPNLFLRKPVTTP